ncbi:hypothetical protein DVH24_006973 [Malus domestica]|uniref:Chromo domain-containing protein n=1 Tax=Malus domestica TaxID=3750 RepID=A0A498ICN0_MALDO|nr:hypothetical protein DVH24_006973 [Malus domestica]
MLLTELNFLLNPKYILFHVSCLKKHLGAWVEPVPLLPLVTDDGLLTQEPEEVLKQRIYKKGSAAGVQLLIKWKFCSEEEATWEDYDSFTARFPGNIYKKQLQSSALSLSLSLHLPYTALFLGCLQVLSEGLRIVLINHHQHYLLPSWNEANSNSLFAYSNQFHNVMQVAYQDFESCNTSSPLITYTSGSDTITLKRSGHMYFLCGAPTDSSASPSPAPGSSSPSASHSEVITQSGAPTLHSRMLELVATSLVVLCILSLVFY